MNYLVKFDKNWADEFNVYGFKIMNAREVELLKAALPFLTFGFGTNEAWEEFEDFNINDFIITEINQLDEAILREHFPSLNDSWSKEFGTFPDIQDALWNNLQYTLDNLESGQEIDVNALFDQLDLMDKPYDFGNDDQLIINLRAYLDID